MIIWILLFALQTQPATHSAFDQKLEAIDVRSGAIRDMSGEFEQLKYSSLSKDPLLTSGYIYARPGVMLWDVREPSRLYMRSDATKLEMYDVKRKLVEEYPVMGAMATLASSPLPRLEELRKRFSLAPTTLDQLLPADEAKSHAYTAVMLTPTDPELKANVASVRVVLDDASGAVRAFELIDPDGERTVVFFKKIEINKNLSDGKFELKLPDDVQRSRPLEGIAPGDGR